MFAAAPRDLVGQGAAEDTAWAAAVVFFEGRVAELAVVRGRFDAPRCARAGSSNKRSSGLTSEAAGTAAGLRPALPQPRGDHLAICDATALAVNSDILFE